MDIIWLLSYLKELFACFADHISEDDKRPVTTWEQVDEPKETGMICVVPLDKFNSQDAQTWTVTNLDGGSQIT